MRYHPRLHQIQGVVIAASLFAAAGCQAPAILAVTGVNVQYGSLNVDPQAALSVTLDLRGLLGAADYHVNQVASTTVSTSITNISQVQTIWVKVTGPNITNPDGIVQAVNAASVTNGMASVLFPGLPAGPVTVVINAEDAAGKVVTWGSQSATIAAGQPATIVVKVGPASQGLTISFSCPGCAVSSGPVNPSDVLGFATGLNVDAQGNLYLFGDKAGVKMGLGWYGDAKMAGRDSPNQGVILKIPPTLQSHTAIDAQFSFMYQADIDPRSNSIRSWVDNGQAGINPQLPDYQTDLLRIISLTGIATSQTPTRFFGIEGMQANTLDPSGNLIIAPGGDFEHSDSFLNGYGLMRYAEPNDAKSDLTLFITNANRPGTAADTRPISLQWDAINSRAIWASSAGLMTIPAKPDLIDANTPPQNLVQGLFYGLAVISPAAGTNPPLETLYTRWDGVDKAVRYLSLRAGNGLQSNTVAFTFKNGFPYRVIQGLDGAYYVMLTQSRPASDYLSDPGIVYAGDSHYRVVKMSFDRSLHTLKPVTLMVDTFPAASGASF